MSQGCQGPIWVGDDGSSTCWTLPKGTFQAPVMPNLHNAPSYPDLPQSTPIYPNLYKAAQITLMILAVQSPYVTI